MDALHARQLHAMLRNWNKDRRKHVPSHDCLLMSEMFVVMQHDLFIEFSNRNNKALNHQGRGKT